MDFFKSLLIFQILLLSISLFSQNKQLEKANKRYQIKKYAEAIPLYEEGLAKHSSISAKTRLAYCYRINNNIDKSAVLYAEIVHTKKPRAITLYYYGEVLMSQGKYDEATIWLKKYTDKKPDDPKGWTLLESIETVQKIQPYYKVANVEEFPHNSDSDDSAPAFYKDGIVFTSDRKTGMKVMKKKSGWTGRDFLSIYYSSKKEDGTYSSPDRLPKRLNNMNKNTGTFTLAPDGTYIIFSRNNDISNRKNRYNLVLYRADVSKEGKFKNVKKLSFCGNSANYMHPVFSADGNTLFYTSDKKGEGGTDIFYSTLSKKGWSRPKNIGTPINTSANEGFPFVDQEGKLFFCSKGHPSYGGFDIFFSQKNEKGKWSVPVNLGKPINSPADDISIFISKNHKKGIFASSRKGGDDDIYFFDIEGINTVHSMDFVNQNLTKTKTETTDSKMNEENISTSAQEQITEVVTEAKTNAPENTMSTKIKTETKTELPFSAIEPFQAEKENTQQVESIVETSSHSNKNTVSEIKTKTKTESKTELPFSADEPFQAEKENTQQVESIVETSSDSNKNTASEIKTETKTKLPFSADEPFQETVTETVEVKKAEKNTIEESSTTLSSSTKSAATKSTPNPSGSFEIEINTITNPMDTATINIEEGNLDMPMKEEATKFDEGLANIDNSMTEEAPVLKNTEKNNEVTESDALKEMKEYLSYESPQQGTTFILGKIKFAPQKYVVTPLISSRLDELVILMNEFPNVKIEVAAHTQSIGDDRKNMITSIKRATAVAGYLIRHGIATDRIKVMGYGETQLLNRCSNNINCSSEEHLINQRIEIKINH